MYKKRDDLVHFSTIMPSKLVSYTLSDYTLYNNMTFQVNMKTTSYWCFSRGINFLSVKRLNMHALNRLHVQKDKHINKKHTRTKAIFCNWMRHRSVVLCTINGQQSNLYPCYDKGRLT